MKWLSVLLLVVCVAFAQAPDDFLPVTLFQHNAEVTLPEGALAVPDDGCYMGAMFMGVAAGMTTINCYQYMDVDPEWLERASISALEAAGYTLVREARVLETVMSYTFTHPGWAHEIVALIASSGERGLASLMLMVRPVL